MTKVYRIIVVTGFVGAGVNTVTRSGTNKVTASVYHRFRNDSFVGEKAEGLPYNPGTFENKNTGVWGSGPIIRNKLFAFGIYEDEEETRPITDFSANAGGEAVGGTKTRVLASDLSSLTNFLQQNFDYGTGPFEGVNDLTPAKRFLLRRD